MSQSYVYCISNNVCILNEYLNEKRKWNVKMQIKSDTVNLARKILRAKKDQLDLKNFIQKTFNFEICLMNLLRKF